MNETVEVNQVLFIPPEENTPVCSKAESLFLEALLEQGKIVLVNGIFLVKAKGKLVALCTEDVYGDEGNILYERGKIYAPLGNTEDILKQNFGIKGNDSHKYRINTKAAIMTIPDAHWVFVRDSAKKDPEQYMKQIDEAIALGQFFPDGKEHNATYESLDVGDLAGSSMYTTHHKFQPVQENETSRNSFWKGWQRVRDLFS